MVEERGELRLLVYPCCFSHTVKRTRRACPALRPERVLLSHVPLRQAPSLHRFRHRLRSIVRRLRRYCRPVQLPRPCIIGSRRLAFPMRPTRPSRWAVPGFPGSRAERFRSCWGLRPRGVNPNLAFSTIAVVWPSAWLSASAPQNALFSRLDGPAHAYPSHASPTPSRAPVHDSGRRRSLLLDVRLFHPLLSAGLSRRTSQNGLRTPRSARRGSRAFAACDTGETSGSNG